LTGGFSERSGMRKKLAVLLMVTLVPMSGAVACGQAVEDRARQEVDKQVEKGKQRVNDEVQKGQDRIEKELSNAQKQVQDGANQAKEKAGGGQ
jgi:Skp family chaperone for outer membrane proteins